MVSNYDRIFKEIKKEAERLSPQQVGAAALVDLAMEIVDLEDQNRIKSVPRIKQRIKELILTTAVGHTTNGGE